MNVIVSPTAAVIVVGVKVRPLAAPTLTAWLAARMDGMRARKRTLENIVEDGRLGGRLEDSSTGVDPFIHFRPDFLLL